MPDQETPSPSQIRRRFMRAATLDVTVTRSSDEDWGLLTLHVRRARCLAALMREIERAALKDEQGN